MSAYLQCQTCKKYGPEYDERNEFDRITAEVWRCAECMEADANRPDPKAKYAAEKKGRIKQAEISELMRLSSLPARFAEWDTGQGDNRLWGHINANLGNSVYYASKVSGVCKTCAMACAARVLIATKRESVLFCRTTKLMRRLTGLYGESVQSADAEMERLTSCDLLILDDLLKEKVTERTGEILWDIIDERYLANRRTWITANCGGVEIEQALGARGQYVRRRIREDFEFLPLDEHEGEAKLKKYEVSE